MCLLSVYPISMHRRARVSFWALLLFKMPSSLPSTQKPSMASPERAWRFFSLCHGKAAACQLHVYIGGRTYSMQCNNMWPCPAGHMLRSVPGRGIVSTKALGGSRWWSRSGGTHNGSGRENNSKVFGLNSKRMELTFAKMCQLWEGSRFRMC